jgi:hypothetical protein
MVLHVETRAMWSDFFVFTWAVLSHWQSYVTGGVMTGLIGVIERLSGKQLPKRVYLSIFVVSFLLAAFFMAWRDEYTRGNQLDRDATAQKAQILDLRNERQKIEGDYSQLQQSLPVAFVEPKGSLRRRTMRLVHELNGFWGKRPTPVQQPIHNPQTEEDRQRNVAWDKYWRDAKTAYLNADYRQRLVGIVREYKNKGVETGFMEQSFDQPERLVGAAPFGGWQLDNCTQYMNELCQLRELTFHVDAHDQRIDDSKE